MAVATAKLHSAPEGRLIIVRREAANPRYYYPNTYTGALGVSSTLKLKGDDTVMCSVATSSEKLAEGVQLPFTRTTSRALCLRREHW